MVALPVLVSQAGGSAHDLGLLFAMAGAGSLVGSLLTAAVRLPFPLTRIVSACAMVGAGGTLVVALTPPLWMLAISVFVAFTLTAPWNIHILTLRQRVPPPELVGRVLSLTMLLNSAGQPGGSAVGGLLVAPLGVPMLVAITGTVKLTNAAASLLSRRWRDFPMRDSEPMEPMPLSVASEAPSETKALGPVSDS